MRWDIVLYSRLTKINEFNKLSEKWIAASFEDPEYFEEYGGLEAAFRYSPFALPSSREGITYQIAGKYIIIKSYNEELKKPNSCTEEEVIKYVEETGFTILCSVVDKGSVKTIIAGKFAITELHSTKVVQVHYKHPLSIMGVEWEPASPPKILRIHWRRLK